MTQFFEHYRSLSDLCDFFKLTIFPVESITTFQASAQTLNPKLKTPPFSLNWVKNIKLDNMNFSLPNIDDRIISFDSFPEAKGFIVVFTCNHCPYAIAYEERLKKIHAKYAPLGYPLIAISSNDPVKYPQDSFDNMKVRAEAKGFEFPYLFDETQDIARMYGAERTPHVYLLHKTPQGLQLLYKGAIDDNYQSEKKVRTHYLTDRIDTLLMQEYLGYSETTAIGCSIKWK